MGYQRYRGKSKDVPPPLSKRGFDYYGAESQLAIDALEKAIAQARRYTAKTPRQLPPGESQYHVVSKGKYLGVFTSHSQVIDSVNGVSGARHYGIKDFEKAREALMDDLMHHSLNEIYDREAGTYRFCWRQVPRASTGNPFSSNPVTTSMSSPPPPAFVQSRATIIGSDPAPTQRTFGINHAAGPISTPIRSPRSTSEVTPTATPTRSPVIELDAGQEDTFTSSPMTIQSFNFSPTKPIDPVSSPPAHSPSEIDTSKLLNGSDIAEVNVEGTPRQPVKRGRRPKSAAKPSGEVTKANVKGTPRQPGKRGRRPKSAAKPSGEVTKVIVEGTPRQPGKVGRPPKSTTQAKAQGSATGPVEDRRHRISKSEPKSSPSLAQKTLTAMFKPVNRK